MDAQHEIFICWDGARRPEDDRENYTVYLEEKDIPEGRTVYVYTNTDKGRIEPRKLVRSKLP